MFFFKKKIKTLNKAMYTQILECGNQECSFKLLLQKNLPIFNENTPKECKMVPIRESCIKHISNYMDNLFCPVCVNVFSLDCEDVEHRCPNCNNEIIDESLNCPKCLKGKLLFSENCMIRF